MCACCIEAVNFRLARAFGIKKLEKKQDLTSSCFFVFALIAK